MGCGNSCTSRFLVGQSPGTSESGAALAQLGTVITRQTDTPCLTAVGLMPGNRHAMSAVGLMPGNRQWRETSSSAPGSSKEADVNVELSPGIGDTRGETDDDNV